MIRQESILAEASQDSSCIIGEQKILVEPYQEPAITEDGSDYKYGFYDKKLPEPKPLATERVFEPKEQILSASIAR